MEELVKSYLQARDPSIQSYNRANLDYIKINLNDMLKNSFDKTEGNSDENKFIQVYLRIRGDIPTSAIYEIKDDNLTCKVPEDSYSFKNVKYGKCMKKTYCFTKIFGHEVDQTTIFNSTAKPRLLSFINGSNSTLFTYGASGSGKTFTIVGTPEEPGVIPRALEFVFGSLREVSQRPEIKPLPNGRTQDLTQNMVEADEQYKRSIINATNFDQAMHNRTYRRMQERLSSEPVANIEDQDVSVSVWVSFSEIYNETIYDLLALPTSRNQPRPRLALGKSKDENTYIKNLTYINVRDSLEAYQILQYGLTNLSYASTVVNAHSSRSHCIFTIRLLKSSQSSREVFVSSFNFCDLAGSERLKKTMNFGERLKESNNINTSLLVLGRCIENIRRCQQVKDSGLIPFRESKLTQIFQSALMGHENVDMMVNINPATDRFDESIHVLNFSAIASNILIEEDIPKPIKRETRLSLLMQNGDLTETKKVVNERREVEKTQHDYYLLQQTVKRQQREICRLNAELEKTSTDCEHEDEIEQLHKIINDIIDERDNAIDIYKKKLKEQEDYLTELYEDQIRRTLANEAKIRKDAMQRVRKECEEKIREMEVITISSSDESSDEEDSPYKSYRKKAEEKIEQFRKAIGELAAKYRTVLEDNDSLRKDKEILQKDIDILVKDAKEEYMRLEMEAESYRKQCNQMESENIALHDKIDTLELLLHGESVQVQSEYSTSDVDENEPENNQRSQIAPLHSACSTFIKNGDDSNKIETDGEAFGETSLTFRKGINQLETTAIVEDD